MDWKGKTNELKEAIQLLTNLLNEGFKEEKFNFFAEKVDEWTKGYKFFESEENRPNLL